MSRRGFTLVTVGISSLLVGAGAVARWPVEPARLRAAPLLSFDGGGSIAIELEPGRRAELSLPPQMAYFASEEEARSMGVESTLAPRDIAAHLQAQLRASDPEEPAFAEASVGVVRSGGGSDALEFVSGPVPLERRLRFVCPGEALGPGPTPPLRRGTKGRALCASKYASPLVAALGAHPALEGVASEPSRCAVWPLGWALLGVCALSLLGVLGAAAATMRGEASARGSRGA